MNKKLTVKNEFGKTVYCVLSDSEPYEKQLMEVLSLRPGCGFSVDFYPDFLYVKDYRTNETVGRFEVLALEETEDDVILTWQE